MAFDIKFIGTIIQWSDSKSASGTRQASLTEDILSSFKSVSITPNDLNPKIKPEISGSYISIEYISTIDSKIKIVQFNNWSDDINGWSGVNSEDFARYMDSFLFSEVYSGGTILLYSDIDERLGDALQVLDGDIDTSETIGTNGVRYIMHDFGGKLDNALNVNRIEWIINSDIDKFYTIEGWNGSEWKVLYSGKTIPGESKKYRLLWSEPQIIYAVRIYHRGDYKTNNPSVQLSLTKNDKGSGTVAYKISAYPDFRDASSRPGADADGWIDTINGTTIIDWDLVENIESWDLIWEPSEIITAMRVFDDILVIGCQSGKIYTNTDSNSNFTLRHTLTSQVNVFTNDDDYIYAGCRSGDVYRSSNAFSWDILIQDTDLNIPDTYPSYEGIISLEIFDDKIFIGTDWNVLYYYDLDLNILKKTKTFADRRIEGLKDYKSNLWILLGPSGRIYKYDKSTYSLIENTKNSKFYGLNKYSDDNILYIHGDRGTIYRYDIILETFYDSASNNILDNADEASIGPTITDLIETTSGVLFAGNWKYAVSYVGYDGNESLIGSISEVNVMSNNRGSVKLYWKKIDNAKYYNIYRTIKNDQSIIFLRLLDSGINSFENDSNSIERGVYVDDGSISPTATRVPEQSKSNMWFSTDNSRLYVYDKNSIITINSPDDQVLIEKIIPFDSSVVISSRESVDDYSKLYKFIGQLTSSGLRNIYVQTKDDLGNLSDVISDEIYFDVLYDKILLEIDSNSTIVESYESNNKIVSADKEFYRFGIYESEPFYASTLSSWDVLRYMIYLPEDTNFEVYARTADTKTDLENTAWFGPGMEVNDETNDYYYDYEGYDTYPGQSKNITGEFDISTLKGKWIQFKIVLKTYTDNSTPLIYSLIIKYFSVNSVYFFTTLFDIKSFADAENVSGGGDITIKRGILSYNGSIPLGGDIQFGIASTNSNNWQDYQIIQPGKVFELDNKSNDFKIGILLISTDEDVALVHEFALMFDIGDNFLHANRSLYDASPYILEDIS